MDREDGVSLHALEGFVHRLALDDQVARSLDEHEGRVALVEVPHTRTDRQRAQRAHAADAEHDLLVQPHLAAADVEDVGDRPVGLGVVGNVRVEQQQRSAADFRQPHGAPDRPAGEVDAHAERPTVGIGNPAQREARRIEVGIGVLLVAVASIVWRK